MDWWSQLVLDWQGQGPLDITITITALIYVVLSARNNPWCWPFGIVSAALWAYASYAYYDLYIDALLQVFYVGMGAWGLYQWQQGGEEGGVKPITQLPLQKHLTYLLIGTIVSIAFGYFFGTYTATAASYWDAFTTVFSVIATWLLVERRLENWLYWIIIDIIYSGLYWSRGAVLLGALMVVYTIIATVAYFNWRKLQAKEKAAPQLGTA